MFVIILDGYDDIYFESIPRTSVQSGWFVFSLPWQVYLVLEMISAVILIHWFREYRHYRKSTVTGSAIRKSIDLLPEGICVSAHDGTVLLANLKMNTLCRELTGERLADAHGLWALLELRGEDQSGKRLIHTSRGESWLFARDTLSIDGKAYERTNAVNVTERYRITKELREKNVHLKEIQYRMKKATELSGEMFIRQEEANARSALHNELGQVLLMGRHYIEHPESTDKAMVALMTRQMNSFLLGETEAPAVQNEDELQAALRLAGGIGVNVRIHGDIPEEGNEHKLLAAAIRECAANAVKHAEGDTLYVEIGENAEGISITITNNGNPPKAPINESGGLLSLRKLIETSGGQMIVQSLPVFSLTLSFLKS
ncbi:MAG: hypothetical protein IJM63_06445 [Solobacterium sp.]|nr:hypothetical protein [Solobacterium sp.]